MSVSMRPPDQVSADTLISRRWSSRGTDAALTGAGLALLFAVLVPSWLMYRGDLHWGIDGSLYTFTLSGLARWVS